MVSRFSGKVVIVTGAARGLGRSHALAFAKEGASVVALDVGSCCTELAYSLSSQEELEGTVDECRSLSGQMALALQADVSNASEVAAAVDKTIQELGRIDILINNAGITTGAQSAHELSEHDWDRMLDINLKGVWLCSKHVIPQMIKQQSGKIVNISSIAGLVAFPQFSSYVASKFGVVGLTKSLAIELAEHDINVNCVCPGIVPSALNDADAVSIGMTVEEGRKEFIKGHLFERLISPEDISSAVLWLSSDEARNVTGIALPVDAGHSSKSPA